MSGELMEDDLTYPHIPLLMAPDTFRGEYEGVVKQYLEVRSLFRHCQTEIACQGRMSYRASVCFYSLQLKLNMLKLTLVHLRFQRKLESELWCNSFVNLFND